MSNAYYEALGRAVWKGGLWYLRHRYVPAPKSGRVRVAAKRVGAGVLVAAAVVGAIVVAQRHGDDSA